MRRIALVLEDQRRDQLAARAVLEQAGLEVQIASTVAQGYELIYDWLSPQRDLGNAQVIVLIDLIMDAHGFHLAALVHEDQRQGLLRPVPLLVLTSGFSSENVHFARVAGCQRIFSKPLLPSMVEEALSLPPLVDAPALAEDELWLREWLISEGARLIRNRLERRQSLAIRWTPEEVEHLLKELSGKGWRPQAEQAASLLERFGSAEAARSQVSMLASLLGEPYDQMLRHLLDGASIEKSGRLLGYGRSQSYQHFRRLAGRLCRLLSQHNADVA